MLTIEELVQKSASNVMRIDAPTAYKNLIKSDGVLIDVREPNEVENSPVAGSKNIPRGVLEMKMLELKFTSDTHIFIHCASGARATLASEQLQRIGFENVYAISSSLNEIQSIKWRMS